MEKILRIERNRLVKKNLKSLIFWLLLFSLFQCQARSPIATVRKGKADLSKIRFQENTVIQLSGDWLFCPDQYVDPNIPASRLDLPECSNPLFVNVPGSLQNSGGLLGSGDDFQFGSYVAKISLPKDQDQLKLAPPVFHAIYRLFVDQEEVSWNGTPGTNEEDTAFIRNEIQEIVDLDNSEFFIVVHIANFGKAENANKTGIQGAFHIADSETLYRNQLEQKILQFFVFGAIFVLGLYHLALVKNYARDISPVLFGGFAIAVSLYSILTSDIFYLLRPEFPLLLKFRSEFVLEFSFLLLLYLFYYNLFPEEFSKTLGWILVSSYLISICVAFCVSGFVLGKLYIYFLSGFFVAILYFCVGILKALTRNREGAILIGIGSLVLLPSVLSEILFTLTESQFLFPYSFPFAILFFILVHSYLFSERFAIAYDDAQQMLFFREQCTKQLQLQLQERDQIARDIHDAIGSEVSVLLHEIENYPPSHGLTEIRARLQILLSRVRDTASLLKAGRDNTTLKEEMENYISRLASVQKYTVEADIANTDTIDSNRVLRMHLIQIFYEWMTNVLRHGGGDLIKIKLTFRRDRVFLRIYQSQNAISWSYKKVDELYKAGVGLKNLRYRVMQIKGRGRSWKSSSGDGIMVVSASVTKK